MKEQIILENNENLASSFNFYVNQRFGKIRDMALFMNINQNHELSQSYWIEVEKLARELIDYNQGFKIKA